MTFPFQKEMKDNPPLSKEEEKILFDKFDLDHSAKIQEAILKHYISLVFNIISRIRGSVGNTSINDDDFEDLGMECIEKLYFAIPKFKKDRGYRFSTFAYIVILNKARSFLKNLNKYKLNYVLLNDPEYFESISPLIIDPDPTFNLLIKIIDNEKTNSRSKKMKIINEFNITEDFYDEIKSNVNKV